MDPSLLQTLADAGLGFVGLIVISFLFYKADQRWNRTIEKLDDRQDKRQKASDEILKDLSSAIRDNNKRVL